MLSRLAARTSLLCVGLIFAMVFLSDALCYAQSYLYATGAPTFNTAQPVESGFVDAANGNLHLEIVLASPSQRGTLGVTEKLVYDSRIWQPVGGVWSPTNVPNSMLGWRFLSPANALVSHSAASSACDLRNGHFTNYGGWSWTSPDGTIRKFTNVDTEYDPTGCDGGGNSSSDAFADDSSGYHMYVINYTSATVYAPDGTQVYPTWKDTNGNSLSTDSNGNVVDTLGRTAVAYSTNGSNQNYYDVLGSDGQTHRFTVTYASTSATSAFTQYTNQSVSQNAITRIDLPDGSYYLFGYDSWGELNNITLPTGGQITYNYTTFTDAYGNQNRWVHTRVVGGQTWTFTQAVVSNSTCQVIQSSGTVSGCQQVTLLKPSGDSIVYTFSLNGGAWNSEADYYNNGGTKVATTTQIYDLSNSCTYCVEAAYVRALTVKSQLPTVGGTLTTQKQYTYDSIYHGNITAVKEWNFTLGTPGASPDREIDIAYLNSSQYLSANIINQPTSKTTYAGACCTTQIAKTVFSYDTTSLVSRTGITHHDDANYGTGNTVRANVTQISQWISGSSYWTTTRTFDTTGQVAQSQDNKGNITYFDYTDRFFNDNGANPPASVAPPNGPTNAYATTITLPVIGAETSGYYFGTGKVALSTDQNSATSYAHYRDPLDRPTQTSMPTGGWQLASYASATLQDTYTSLTDTTPSTGCSSCRHDQTVLDSLGRVSNTPLVNDPDGQINVISSYDANGRLGSRTNLYRSTSESTYGSTSLAYDGLDRVTLITRPDGNTVVNAYGTALGSATSVCGVTAFPSMTTDEGGKKRQYWNDAFGRLLEVDEPDSGGGFTIATCYQYDLLDNLLSATQRGGSTNSSLWRVYSYQSDGLSRVTQASTPEAGITTFSYTSSGAACSGNPSLPCSRTDARNITTSYGYDGLNRLTSKTYSDGTTPSVSYYYDQGSYNGLTITNGKGRRTGMSDGSGQTAWSYDAAGNVLARQQTIAGVSKSIGYTYNLDGSVASITYPSGRVLRYGYSNALRAVSLTDAANNFGYVSNAHYTAAGMLSTASQGANPNWTGISETNTFNNRLQLTRTQATSPVPLTLLDLGYSFDQGGGKNNGNVVQLNNNKDTTRSVAYTYDQLNRLASAGTYNATTWGDSYMYDNWGNLLQKNVTQGTAENLQATVDAHNHINSSGFTYDAAGNLTWDTINALKFDAENRMNPVSGLSYTYDGRGIRIAKSDGTVYWTDDADHPLAKSDAAGNIKAEYLFFNGTRIGYYDSVAGNPYIYLSDALGSTSVIAAGDGKAITWEADYYPFGTKRIITSNFDNHFLFTGYEYDYETGYHYAVNRYQSPNIGRFYSADPAGAAAVDPANPQSWNQYAYVINNPASTNDPLGLWCGAPMAGGERDSTCNPSNSGGGGGSGGGGYGFGGWDPWQLGSIRVTGAGWVPLNGSGPGPSFSGPGYDATTQIDLGYYWDTHIPIGTGWDLGVSIDWGWWKSFGNSFVSGVVHGVRQPGQTVSDCMNQNVTNMTFGAVNPQKLADPLLGQAEAAAVFLSTTRGGTFNIGGVSRPVSIGTQFLRWGTGALGLTGAARVLAVTAGVAVLRAGAVAGAATVGTAVGSAINCR